MKPYDILLVGAGLYNSVFAYVAGLHGKKCLVVERRKHTGGNVYSERRDGIDIHCYGAHIFHTSDKNVWDFVNSVTPFYRYIHTPLARNGDYIYNLPFNMNTFYQMWGCRTPDEAAAILQRQRQKSLDEQIRIGHFEPQNLKEQAIRLVGEDIYSMFIRDYTEKQWGCSCEELPPDIIKRLPVRLVFNNNYFDDRYQGMPSEGYNRLIDRLLCRAEIRLGCDFFMHRSELRSFAEKMVYSGSIDEYFGYSLGKLEYRSVALETERLDAADIQGCAVVNWCSHDVPFTRTIEHKHFSADAKSLCEIPLTYVSKEYSSAWRPGLERCYPVNDHRNMKLYRQYAAMASGEHDVIFGGRLAEYRYYDMDDIVAKALADVNEFLQKHES